MYRCVKTGLELSLVDILKKGYDTLHINKTCDYVETWKLDEYYKYISIEG